MKYLDLPHGKRMPALGLGTFGLNGSPAYEALRHSLDAGYRHIDTARAYRNEAEVGAAIRDSQIDREQLFITTKIWPTHYSKIVMPRAMDSSLRSLKSDYVDLVLLHWPSSTISLEETLEALQMLVERGRTRSVGVSNFDMKTIHAIKHVHGLPLACSQIEYHALLDQRDAVEFAKDNQFVIVAHTPLAKGMLCRHPLLREIGDKHGKTAAQIALRWLVQQEHVGAIPKASSKMNLSDNINIFDFELCGDDMSNIFRLNANTALVNSRQNI